MDVEMEVEVKVKRRVNSSPMNRGMPPGPGDSSPAMRLFSSMATGDWPMR